MELHPQLIEKEGRNEFVVLPFQEYQQLTELVDDYMDLISLRQAKEDMKGKKGVPLKQVIAELEL